MDHHALVKFTGRVRLFAGGGLGMSYDNNDDWLSATAGVRFGFD